MATGVLLSDTGYKYSIWQVLCMMQSLSLWLCTASHTAAQLTSVVCSMVSQRFTYIQNSCIFLIFSGMKLCPTHLQRLYLMLGI